MYKRAALPNLVTIGNLFLGFFALLMISQDNLATACWLLVVAAILDGLDGLLARLVRSDSTFGIQIDSLVDVVSFGVTPSFLLYKLVFHDFGILGILFAFMPLLAGVLRLARYNTLALNAERKKGFSGMPIPSAAIVIASCYLYLNAVQGSTTNQALWFSITPMLSLLMLSPIYYRSMPVITIHGSRHPWLGVTILIITTVAVIIRPALTIFPLMLIYTITGPIELGVTQLRKLLTQRDENEVSESGAAIGRESDKRSRRRRL